MKSFSFIYFYSTADALGEFRAFGEIVPQGKNEYMLIVDGRFDFDEVLQFIEEYG